MLAPSAGPLAVIEGTDVGGDPGGPSPAVDYALEACFPPDDVEPEPEPNSCEPD